MFYQILSDHIYKITSLQYGKILYDADCRFKAYYNTLI